MMKKLLLFITSLFIFITPLISQNLDDIYGIWEGQDRFIFIEEASKKDVEKGAVVGENTQYENQRIELVILLKDFYGWYYDRVAESENYSNKYPRTRNSATPKNAEHVYLDILPIDKSSLTNTYNFILNFSKRQNTYVPVVIIDDNMFLDFAIRSEEDNNFYRGISPSKGITISEQSINKNLTSYYVKDDFIYNIRYWITDMDYEEATVTYEKDNVVFNVEKHIKSNGNIYTCVPGRRRIIRNPNDKEKIDLDKYYFTEDKSILLLDSTPYLTKLVDKKTFEDLMKIMEKANSRNRPDPDPLFPDMEVDYHWDVIEYLEKNNEIIQAVRDRQRAFGPRRKDFIN